MALWCPRLSGAPPQSPPTTTELLRRVLAQPANHPTNEHRFDLRYRYVRTRTFEVRAGDGDIIRREATRIDHRPGMLSGEADDAVVPTDAKGAKGRAYQRADFQLNEALLARFTFTVAGSEDIGGRTAWVLDFQPASDQLPAKDLKDRFVNRTAGRVWIDAREAVVVRATFRLLSPVGVLGGLVGSVKRCEIGVERHRTEAGDWFTRRLEWRLEGRKLFARRSMYLHEERTNMELGAPIVAGEIGASPSSEE